MNTKMTILPITSDHLDAFVVKMYKVYTWKMSWMHIFGSSPVEFPVAAYSELGGRRS